MQNDGSREDPRGEDRGATSAGLSQSLLRVLLVTVVACQLLVWVYTCATLQAPLRYWLFGLRFVVVSSALTFGVSFWLARRAAVPIVAWLEEASRGEPSAEASASAYRAVLALPRTVFVQDGVGIGAVSGIFCGAALGLLIPGLAKSTQVTIGVSVLATSAFTFLFAFSALKRRIEPVATRIAERAPEVAARDGVVRRLSVRTKLVVAVMAVLAVSMAVVSSVAGGGASQQLRRVIALGQQRVLENAAQHEKTGDDAVYAARNEANLQFLPMRMFLIDPATRSVLDADEDATLTELELDIITGEAGAHGASGTVPGASTTVTSWRRVEDGTLLLARTDEDAVSAQSGSLSALLLGVYAAGLCVAAMVAVMLAREVSDPLRRMRELVEQMATGDLRVALRIESDDEVGDLARSFAHMSVALRGTIWTAAAASERVERGAAAVAAGTAEVKRVTSAQEAAVEGMARSVGGITRQATDIARAAEALHGAVAESSASVSQLAALGADLHSAASMLSQQTDDVTSSIEQLARGVRHVADNANGLGGVTQETASAMEQMARSMAEVESGANECASLAEVAVRSAETGRERVADAVRCMEEIRAVTSTAESVIGDLGGRARKIGHVVDVIDDVADETTLLALNAAIIAAQAGEHGRGFAVVAQQIKELANRVLASTKEIAELVSGVQEGSERAREAIDRGAKVVERGVGLSADANRALDEIARASSQAGQRVGTIVHAVQEQVSAARHVAELSERVATGVVEIREAGREQEQANQAVLRAAAHTRDAAASVSVSASQQAEGSARIRASAESLRDAAERIERALQSQSAACREAETLLTAVTDGARANGESAEQMAEAMRGLAQEADGMRDAVRRFRL